MLPNTIVLQLKLEIVILKDMDFTSENALALSTVFISKVCEDFHLPLEFASLILLSSNVYVFDIDMKYVLLWKM